MTGLGRPSASPNLPSVVWVLPVFPAVGQFQEPSVTISEDFRMVPLSCSPHCPGLTQNPVTHPVYRVLNTFFSAGEKSTFVTYHPEVSVLRLLGLLLTVYVLN